MVRGRPGVHDDAGFGLTEVLVSLVLLAIMFASFAPLLVGALQTSARSTALATSTQIANQQIEKARATAAGKIENVGCQYFQNFLGEPIDAVTDAQGRTYTVTQTSPSDISCPTSRGALVPYWVHVTADGANKPADVRITTELWTRP